MYATFNDILMALPPGASSGTLTNYKSTIFSKGQKIGIKEDSNLIEVMDNAYDVCQRMRSAGLSIDDASAFFKALRGVASKGTQTERFASIMKSMVGKLERYNNKIVHVVYGFDNTMAKESQTNNSEHHPPEIMAIRTPDDDDDSSAFDDVVDAATTVESHHLCQVKKMMQEMRRLYNDINTKYLMLMEKNNFMERIIEELMVGNHVGATRMAYKGAMERYAT